MAVLAASLSALLPAAIGLERGEPVVRAAAQQPASEPAGRHFVVSPDGAPKNPGTLSKPRDLNSVFADGGFAKPGDTFWLRGGTYRGPFTSYLTGTESAPITVIQYPGERATFDGLSEPELSVLTIRGSDTVYRGFEVTNSAPRQFSEARGAGLTVHASRTKVINVVVHDTGDGIGLWSDAVDSELYGNIVYNSGWEASDRGHGHSVYAQNQTGIKSIKDNILFNSFSFGVHAYTQSGYIDNIHLEGNISFGHGLLSAQGGPKANYLVGGLRVAANPRLIRNFGYYPLGSNGRNIEAGYIAGCRNAAVTDNYMAGGVPLVLTRCNDVVLTNNTFVGPLSGAVAERYPDNTYYSSRPNSAAVFVLPNGYEEGRAHIVVYNWPGHAEVSVDLSDVSLDVGQTFEIRDVQNYFGPPVMSDRFDGGTVTLPMTGGAVSTPVPNAPLRAPHTAPQFAVFVVTATAD